ncbi:MAG: hypothetical protein IJK23_02835 [Clostridia bacterium]|nr:hypothetical protein [Clostridia bacterium]
MRLCAGDNVVLICGLSDSADPDSLRLFFPSGVVGKDMRILSYQEAQPRLPSADAAEELAETQNRIQTLKTVEDLWIANGKTEGDCVGFASIVDLFGEQLSPLYGADMSYYNVYNFTVLTSARGQFAAYAETLCKSLASLELNDDFVKQMLKNGDAFFTDGQKVNDSITDVYYRINAAWDARARGSDLAG